MYNFAIVTQTMGVLFYSFQEMFNYSTILDSKGTTYTIFVLGKLTKQEAK